MGEQSAIVIAGRHSLRAPQRQSVEILDELASLINLEQVRTGPASSLRDALAAVNARYPTVTDFERDFPNVCFALATGVGKTRLMAAFVTWLQSERRIRNFIVIAPNLTIYNKLIIDFSPDNPRYLLRGFSEFVQSPPIIVTGENYQDYVPRGDRISPIVINIFNIAKLTSEIRDRRKSRLRSVREVLGESYFDYLTGLSDLVLIMDESHRYRATAAMQSLNQLKPILGLELTATPFVERAGRRQVFNNIVYEYSFAQAMEDGFVKEPAIATRENLNVAGMSAPALERLKLDDGMRLHENAKVELEIFARQSGLQRVKPFALIIARDTTHATTLMKLVTSTEFCEGRYAGKAIQIDSGSKEDETIARLLRVEQADEPTEIVIHVNMLGLGWDVTNLYTIIPLRAASAKTLVVQTIGRGSRLPYGRRTGVAAIDRLTIVAHDRFQQMLDEARLQGASVREVVLTDEHFSQRLASVDCVPILLVSLGLHNGGLPTGQIPKQEFSGDKQLLAAKVWKAITDREAGSNSLSHIGQLKQPEVQRALAAEVARQLGPLSPTAHCMAEVVERVVELVLGQTIGIPIVRIVPQSEKKVAFQPFDVDVSALPRASSEEALWISHVRTGQVDRITTPGWQSVTNDPEDLVIASLADRNDVAYDVHADLLHDLVRQTLSFLRTRMYEAELLMFVRLKADDIAAALYAQMRDHVVPCAEFDDEVRIIHGFMPLRTKAFGYLTGDAPIDLRKPLPDKRVRARSLYVGFDRCLYSIAKFQSDTERQMAMILDREAEKWLQPAQGQLQLTYQRGGEEPEYVPDFVAEFADFIALIETKAAKNMQDADVLAKRDAAITWCRHASEHSVRNGGKRWLYLLVPHDAVMENVTIEGLVRAYADADWERDQAATASSRARGF